MVNPFRFYKDNHFYCRENWPSRSVSWEHPTCSHSSVLNNYNEVPWLLSNAKSMGMKIEKGNVKIGEAGYYNYIVTTRQTCRYIYIKRILEIINIYIKFRILKNCHLSSPPVAVSCFEHVA